MRKTFPFPHDTRPGVYRIKHLESGREYIGSASNFFIRWRRHYYELMQQTHPNEHFLRAWAKYGANAFEWSVIEVTEKTQEALLEAEQRHLDTLFQTGNLFNICKIAGSTFGIPKSEATRKKMSESYVYHPPFDKETWTQNMRKANKAFSELVWVYDDEGKNHRVKPEDPHIKSGEWILGRFATERIVAHNQAGRMFHVSLNDPRIISGELIVGTIGMKGRVDALDSNGKFLKVKPDDPRFATGELKLGGVYNRSERWRQMISKVNKENVATRCGASFKEKMSKLKMGNAYLTGRVWATNSDSISFLVNKNDSRLVSGELKAGRPKMKKDK